MQYKTISFLNEKFKFNRGINAISIDDVMVFDVLASPLMAIAKTYDNSFEPFHEYEYNRSFPDRMSVDFSFSNGDRENITFDFCDYNIVSDRWISKYFDLGNQIVEKEKVKPILAYYRRGNCVNQDVYKSDVNFNNLNKLYKEREWFPWKDWNKEYDYFSKLAIEAKYGNKNDFAVFHYNNLKQIIDEILSVNHSDGFDFPIDVGKFICYNDSRCLNVATDNCDLGITVGMIMQLYIGCLSRKEDNFIGNPCDCKGIVVCNYNFGERPAYSDKKWEYYRVFAKYFPNIQFIVC